MTTIEELPEVAGRLVASAGRAVVKVGRDGRGSGLVIAPGSVMTSAHNLRGAEATVTFGDGRSVTATVAATDADGDVAVLNAETAGATPIGWAVEAAGALRLGSPIAAVALAPGGGVRVTFGTVSSLGRSFRGPRGRLIGDGVEHTAPLGRGSSGGPLFDLTGNLVGINTHRTGDGMYLAVPAGEALKARVDALQRGETPSRRRLGVGLAPPGAAAKLRVAVGLAPRDGVLVREVADGSPAAEAGVQRGDLIVAAGGSPIESIDSLLSSVDSVGSDGLLTLSVVRGAEELEIVVRFPEAAGGA